MNRLAILLALALPAMTPGLAAQTLDELAREVREAALSEARINEAREARFLSDRDRQRELLEEARAELADENARSDMRISGTGGLTAGEVQAALDDSMVTAQLPGRTAFLSDLAQRRELPTVTELRQLWSAMVTEIAESGEVVSFAAPVERASGEREEREVVRVGVFNAVSGGLFLDWDTGRSPAHLIELPRQPAARFGDMAERLQGATPGEVMPMSIDFTRGQILRAVVRTKTPLERVRQDGGVVGYIIIAVGALGLLLCLWKLVALARTGRGIRRQIGGGAAGGSNPLGRVLAVYSDHRDIDLETLELKLDEAILRETAPIETGLGFIKVLFVVAPLLGLLGTVVGMIATFQMITLFGTGDPRMMAGGISTALVTTVLGLAVAIPLTLLHSYLQGKARGLVQVLEEQAAGIVARLAEERR